MTDETTKPDEQTKPQAGHDLHNTETSWGGTCDLCAQETQHEGQPCDECLETLEHDEAARSALAAREAQAGCSAEDALAMRYAMGQALPPAPADDDLVVTFSAALADLYDVLPFTRWERRPGSRHLTAALWGMNMTLTQEAPWGAKTPSWRCVICGTLADHDAVRIKPSDAVLDALDAAWTWARLASAGPAVRPLLPGEVSQLEAQRAKAECAKLQAEAQQLQAQVHQLQERCAALETRHQHEVQHIEQQDAWLKENDQALAEGRDRVQVWQKAAQDALDQLAEVARQRDEIAQQAERQQAQAREDWQQLQSARAQLQALMQGLGARASEPAHQVLEFTIRNHRDEVRDARLLASTVSLYTEPDAHHPQPGLKLKGWDLERQDWRSFDLRRQLVDQAGCHFDYSAPDRKAAHKAAHDLMFTEEMQARATWLVAQLPSGRLYLVGIGKGERQGMLYLVERQTGSWDQAGEGSSSPYRVRLGPAGVAPLTFPVFLGASLFESIEGAERARDAAEARRQRDEAAMSAPKPQADAPQVQVHVKGADADRAMTELAERMQDQLGKLPDQK